MEEEKEIAFLKRLFDTFRSEVGGGISGKPKPFDPAETIAWIQNQTVISAVPILLDSLLHPNVQVSNEAAKKVRALSETVKPADLFWFDEWVRRNISWGGLWSALKPRQLKTLSDGKRNVEILTFAAFHTNGHVRENAIRLFPSESSSLHLGILAVRLNDWVEPVREAAKQAFLETVEIADHSTVVNCLPVVSRLEYCERADHSEVFSAIRARLKSDAGKAELIKGLGAVEKADRRAAFRFASDLFGTGADLLLQTCLQSFDPIIRLSAAREFFDNPGETDTMEIVVLLLKDPFPPVRSLALDVVRVDQPDDVAKTILLEALFDPSQSIRRYCQFYLRKHHSFDPAPEYRAALETDSRPKLVATILGLSECGGQGDVELILPNLANRFPSVRAAGLRAIGVLGNESHLEVVLENLDDSYPRVTKAAVGALKVLQASFPFALFRRIQESATHEHTCRRLLDLVPNLNRWDQPLVLIPVCAEEGDAIRQKASTLLSRWLASSRGVALWPSEKQLGEIERLFDRHRRALDPKDAGSLSVYLRTCKTELRPSSKESQDRGE